MRVSELAKEYGLSALDILGELKSLKLKAKDGKQELSSAALAVVRRSLEKNGKKVVPPQPKEEKKLVAKVVESSTRKVVKPEKEKAVKVKPKGKKVLSGKVKEVKNTGRILLLPASKDASCIDIPFFRSSSA